LCDTEASLRPGYTHCFGGRAVSPLFGIQHLFEAHYNNNVRMNAAGSRFFLQRPSAT
jgi:hypothetical protein